MPAVNNTKRTDTIVILDEHGLITGVDTTIENTFDYSSDELIGLSVETLITEIIGDDSATFADTSIHQRLLNIIGLGECRARARPNNRESISLTLSVTEVVLKSNRQLLVTLQTPARSEFEQWITRDWYRVFNAAERAIAICSADGKTIELVSAAFAAMHGYTVDELIGKPFADLCAPACRDAFATDIGRAITSGSSHFETMLEHRQGYSLPLTIDFATIGNADGSIAYCIAYLLENSEQKKKEENLRIRNEFLQASYDQAAVATAICNIEGRFISVNAAMCEFIGYTETELLSMHFTDITHPDDIRPNIVTRQQALSKKLKNYSQEKRYIHKSGKSIWAVLVVSLVDNKNGETAFTLGQMIDLDKDQATGHRLKWAYEQRNNLVREVHHRIKNNLQSVTGLLRRHIYTNPAASETLRQAISQVEAIALVHGLESSGENRRIQICDILRGIVSEANKLQAETEAIQYPSVLEPPALVRSAEAVPIALILSELLANAIKHHCPLHVLNVHIAIERSKPDVVRIAISNPAQAPAPEFDFNYGKGVGQGLKLVRALMPKENMQIKFDFEDGNMTATITLSPPIIYAVADVAPNESLKTLPGSAMQ